METEDINFFGYKKYAKKWNEEDEEVINIKNLLKILIINIQNDEVFLYPKIHSYHFPKYSNVDKLFLEPDLFSNDLFEFSFNLDEICEEMENAERLLLDSKSGHEFFKVVVDEGDREQFIIEKEITDKIPGKILNHRTINTGEIELLMKWKYLSYEESTWIKKEDYDHIYEVKLYCIKLK